MIENITVHHLKNLADAIDSERVVAPYSSVNLNRIIPNDLSESTATYLNELYEYGYNNKSLANTLRLLAKEREHWKTVTSDSLDLVWTGPEAPGSYSRDTSVVVRELFQSAQDEVLVSGYAVYQGLSVFKELASLMDSNPNLKVSMFFDVKREYRDTTTEDDSILATFRDRFINEQWPGKRLPNVYYDPRSLNKDQKKRTALHAKCVVVDKKVAFISSANFTEAAQFRNIEAGLLVKSEWLAQKLKKQFFALIEVNELKPLIDNDK